MGCGGERFSTKPATAAAPQASAQEQSTSGSGAFLPALMRSTYLPVSGAVVAQGVVYETWKLRQYHCPARCLLAQAAGKSTPAELLGHPVFQEWFCGCPQIKVGVEVASQSFDIQQRLLQHYQLRLNFNIELARCLKEP